MNLVWFRRDLRVKDNPALYEACKANKGVIAIHIETPLSWAKHDMGNNQISWLRQNLTSLEKDLAHLGIPLLRLQTDYFSECPSMIASFVKKNNIEGVYFNLEYEWNERRRDRLVNLALKKIAIAVYSFHEQCLFQPDKIFNKQGKAYTVFTPYKKACLAQLALEPQLALPLQTPKQQQLPSVQLKHDSESAAVSDIFYLSPGSQSAHQQLQQFVSSEIDNYKKRRDYPDLDATSKLSAYLTIGVLSIRECISAICEYYAVSEIGQLTSHEGVMTWVSELIWRDFYKMICFQYPHVSRAQPFKKETSALQWHNDPKHITAWQAGQTGVPIVDAAMRQLNETGWMHNRLRMVVAMYLSKNLWCDWRIGEAYFASKLIDWDFASNNGGWQWSASTGTDAAPYFRIFNPISQSERFDPEGNFIKKYCPELRGANKKNIHDPYQGGWLKSDYPKPLVDLKSTRAYAIEAFKQLKSV